MGRHGSGWAACLGCCGLDAAPSRTGGGSVAGCPSCNTCSTIHCCPQYYSLDISFFKSSLDSHLLDLLWNKYWVSIQQCPFLGLLVLVSLAWLPVARRPAHTAGQASSCLVCDLQALPGVTRKLHAPSAQVSALSSNPLLGTRDLVAGQLADIGGLAGEPCMLASVSVDWPQRGSYGFGQRCQPGCSWRAGRGTATAPRGGTAPNVHVATAPCPLPSRQEAGGG